MESHVDSSTIDSWLDGTATENVKIEEVRANLARTKKQDQTYNKLFIIYKIKLKKKSLNSV